MSIAVRQLAVPLVVDVDGTLVRSDLLWEGLVLVALRRPGRLLPLMPALLRGRAAFKAAVAAASELEVDHVPLEPATLDLIDQARADGQPVVLASAAHESQVQRLATRVGADDVLGSTANENLKGAVKLERIRARYPAFDYVGNDDADLPLWAVARRAFAVNPAGSTVRRARLNRDDLVVVRQREGALRATLRLVRPHQWSKNTLLFLPALAAHLTMAADVVLTLLAGFVAFSFVASAVYIVNDLADLASDRVHATKRSRPLAAGDLTIPRALAVAAGLVVAAAVIAATLPPAFQALLAGYLALTTAYSMVLKRRAIVDVITLASLYTLRVMAGAALVAVPLSRWFLAFSVFFFFSLALAKRVVELARQPAGTTGPLPGRGYSVADVPVLISLGTTAVMASTLVYCLYITGTDVGELYRRPDLLWLGLPILLYWQSRLWMFAGRNALHEDPVVFAMKDRISRVLLVGFLLVVWVAA
jgi:4-hydroxybenzoate polyprenyltransferase